MARFRGTIIGARGAASRLGHASSGLIVEANGWNAGFRIEVTADGERDVFRVYETGGSNNRTPHRLIFETLESEVPA